MSFRLEKLDLCSTKHPGALCGSEINYALVFARIEYARKSGSIAKQEGIQTEMGSEESVGLRCSLYIC